MLLKYPELIVVAPGLDRLLENYDHLPKIGCASPDLVSVWLCWSTLYAFDEKSALAPKEFVFFVR